MLLLNEPVTIGYYISSYTGGFLNIIICNINIHSVYISYTLRISSLLCDYIIKEVNYVNITNVKCMGKFDEGSIPELDAFFYFIIHIIK